jgi:iron complex outermembrane receptor protein
MGLAWRQGAHNLKASVFSTRFANFISLDATGADITRAGDGGAPDTVVPEYRFRGVRARLRGVEIEGRTRLLQGTLTLDLSGSLDLVRGDNLSLGEPLPRLPPTRTRLGLEAGFSGLRAGVELRHAARQARVSESDTATAGATMLDLWARGSLWGGSQTSGSSGSWFAKLGNATDELAFNAVSVATVRRLSPLPGRALSAGIQLRW